jgi:hypothetical protein
MTYSIGQIIYVLSNKTQTVLPGIVQEEIHYRSLNGENVSYKIAIGPQNKQRVVDLSSLDGEVFGSLEDVRTILINKLTAFVDDLCQTTNERVNQWYGAGSRPIQAGSPAGRLDPSDLLNEVGQHSAFKGSQPQNLNGLRAAMAEPDLNTREVIMDDGTIRKISVNIAQQG